MLLVANKVDLIHQRKVSEEQGREMAEKLKVWYWILCDGTPPTSRPSGSTGSFCPPMVRGPPMGSRVVAMIGHPGAPSQATKAPTQRPPPFRFHTSKPAQKIRH